MIFAGIRRKVGGMDNKGKREKNERLFKGLNADLVNTVNTVLEKTGKRLGDEPMKFICECANRNCTHMFEVKIEDYRQLSRDDKLFMVIPGHEDASMEEIVDKRTNFYVVIKADS
jgi:hypothetical protein